MKIQKRFERHQLNLLEPIETNKKKIIEKLEPIETNKKKIIEKLEPIKKMKHIPNVGLKIIAAIANYVAWRTKGEQRKQLLKIRDNAILCYRN